MFLVSYLFLNVSYLFRNDVGLLCWAHWSSTCAHRGQRQFLHRNAVVSWPRSQHNCTPFSSNMLQLVIPKLCIAGFTDSLPQFIQLFVVWTHNERKHRKTIRESWSLALKLSHWILQHLLRYGPSKAPLWCFETFRTAIQQRRAHSAFILDWARETPRGQRRKAET